MQKRKRYDLIVAGGGLAGVCAAVAAAREGARVLLIEKYGCLGGMATAGLVNPFMAYALWVKKWSYDWEKKVNRGIFEEIIKELKALEGLHANNQTFNEELLKLVLDRLIIKNGISILLHSTVSKATVKENRLESILVTNKSGNTSYSAGYYVDATGDADLCALSGCDYKVGRESDGLCQPMTLCFRLAGVDDDAFSLEKDREKVNGIYKRFKEKQTMLNPRNDVLMFEHMANGVVHFNSTRIIGKSAIDAADLTQAELEGREQVYELYRFMKQNVEGFENCRLLMSAPQMGIRESRRITGEYTITKEDILSARKFEDSIARGTYPIDIHDPKGGGAVITDIPYGDYYTIPYRALAPKGIDNIIVAGRAISSTHEAHSAYRIMPICANIGEGAGIAAAIAAGKGLPFRNVDSLSIQKLLAGYGGVY